MDKMIEEVTIGKQIIRLQHEDVPIEKIEMDRDNPRIRYRLKLEQNGKSLEEVIQEMPEVHKLRKDIEANGGLRERVILQENGNGKFKAVEGNCRLVCFQSLNEKHKKKDERWKKVPARILPKDVDPKAIAILLSDFHVAGKIAWRAHEKAGQVYHMNKTLHMPADEIATYLRASKTTVLRLLLAYEFMVDQFLKIDEERYAKQGERKWSYFEELHKSKELREYLKNEPDFGDKFCRWVGDGRLPEGADVRVLASILKHAEARKKFESGNKATALAEAKKIVEAGEPEHGSEFFKLLAKVRDSLTNAAQVKEILRIRTDKVARQRLIETHAALVDFMRLADVEPEVTKH